MRPLGIINGIATPDEFYDVEVEKVIPPYFFEIQCKNIKNSKVSVFVKYKDLQDFLNYWRPAR